ncbi:MAG: hypothetical protein VX589_06740 [Myxococcota bacterium]|nr:hypothetical protein [Myxococcota bacterium]
MRTSTQEIHPTTLRVLNALRAGVRLSRNQNFALFKDARARQGLRLYRYLRSVAADVRAYGERLTVTVVEPTDVAGDIALRIDIPRLNGHRTAYLRPVELELLAEDAPEIAEILVRCAPLSS